MPRLQLRTSRQQVDDPDLELLHEIVVADCPRYWTVAPGDAALFHDGPGGRSQLGFVFSPDAGCYWVTYQRSGSDDEYALERPGGGDDEICLELGGDPVMVPRRFFVTPAETWTVVRTFASGGAIGDAPPGLRWVIY